jgi:hypothetical protein
LGTLLYYLMQLSFLFVLSELHEMFTQPYHWWEYGIFRFQQFSYFLLQSYGTLFIKNEHFTNTEMIKINLYIAYKFHEICSKQTYVIMQNVEKYFCIYFCFHEKNVLTLAELHEMFTQPYHWREYGIFRFQQFSYFLLQSYGTLFIKNEHFITCLIVSQILTNFITFY